MRRAVITAVSVRRRARRTAGSVLPLSVVPHVLDIVIFLRKIDGILSGKAAKGAQFRQLLLAFSVFFSAFCSQFAVYIITKIITKSIPDASNFVKGHLF
jgi:hypothetical protein